MVELGGGFAWDPDADAILGPAKAGRDRTVMMMKPPHVNARAGGNFPEWLSRGPLGRRPLRYADQQHGARVVDASESTPPDVAQADGLRTSGEDALAVFCADCAPIWMTGPGSHALVMLHAGWRGVAAGILERGVAEMIDAGVAAGDIAVAVGPHLRSCCFEVGPEVARVFAEVEGALQPAASLRAPRQRIDGVALDLLAVIHARLGALGVAPSRISAATVCTRCRPELFHSYRRNGPGGPLMAAIGARA